MQFISSNKLKPGMVLAMDLVLYNKYNFKTLLLREGLELSNSYISKICSNDISGVYIKNEEVSGFEKNIISEEFEVNVLTKIKDIYYNYKLKNFAFDKRMLSQVSYLADYLIEETILTKALLYRVLEYNNKEDYLFQHGINVAILSISLGDSLELSPHMLHELSMAAILHDIGMLYVPSEILYKQDSLTDEELEIIREHPVNAVKALRSFVSNDVLMGILSHHERLNGSGYPHGLSGEQIHLFAKILAVCDVYQASKEREPSQVIQYLSEGKNIKFDADITGEFLKNIIVYPTNHYVKLNNGKTAIVMKSNPVDCLRPVIQILNPYGSLGEEVDLSSIKNEHIEITGEGNNFEYIVSACLCGEKTRYDGKVLVTDKIKRLVDEGKAIMVCPEVLGGLKVPRLPCEIKSGRVINIASDDKTEHFIEGAFKTLETAKNYGIKKAILKEKSPSCGSKYIYDGTFTKALIKGRGITTGLLQLNDIEVISEEEF
ncbi:MAG: 2-thiouracil desulfurase family protein [Tissierellia bacterium]|nr:2-thiouracil desulfurase family protein [Tissierellia bacterium]